MNTYDLSLIARDLDAPLRRIVTLSERLEQQCGEMLDAQARHTIDLISQNGRTAQQHITSLRQYARLDSVPLQWAQTDCRQVVLHCLDQLAAPIEACNACIFVGELPTVNADRERIGLLFYALLSNAITFSASSPVIDITASRAGDSWVFSVADNGIGIAAHHYDAIFDPFWQLHHEISGGNGMGLALAKKIATLHGGRLWVESVPQEGATFYFALPNDPVKYNDKSCVYVL